MTLLKELMLQYKTTIDDVSRYSGVEKENVRKYFTGESSLLDCPTRDFAALAELFHLTVQELWDMAEHYDFNPKDFEIFKSNTCHTVKEFGNRGFISEIVDKEYIETYWNNKNRLCACYLLAMIDYLCRIEQLPLFEKFERIRKYKLPKLIYPYSFNFINDEDLLQDALKQAIPEFYRHGIIEGDIFNVC